MGKEALRDILPSAWAEFLGIQCLEMIDKIESKIDFSVTYPAKNDIFRAFVLTAPQSVKVVLLGQDPYHNGVANGLSFAVKSGSKIPPSLKNIYKEIEQSLNIQIKQDGDLNTWAKNGILLLNTILSVEKSSPQSHANIGWEKFSDLVIEKINLKLNGVIYILLGNHAKSKAKLIDTNKHFVISATHPSPLAQMGKEKFIGSGIFKKTREILGENLFC